MIENSQTEQSTYYTTESVHITEMSACCSKLNQCP